MEEVLNQFVDLISAKDKANYKCEELIAAFAPKLNDAKSGTKKASAKKTSAKKTAASEKKPAAKKTKK